MGFYTMNKLAILGGTFNPIHIGHLMVAEDIRQLFGFEKVLFVPSALPPHKSAKGIISSRHRLAMTALATRDNPHFEVSSVEVERGGKSYTVETLEQIKQVYGEDMGLYFLVGSDAFMEISSWKDISRLFELCRFVVINRPGGSLEGLSQDFLKGVKSVEHQLINRANPPTISEAVNVYLVETLLVDVSSSGIRELIRWGGSIKYLVPHLVEEYIVKNQLYQEEKY